MFKLSQINEQSTAPDITPLLDVVFILLIFFIIASAFAVRGLDMQVPAAKSSSPISGRVVEITLDAQGNIFAEGIPMARKDFKFFIQKTSRSFMEKPGQMMLKADPMAPAHTLIFIVDEVRQQGGERIIIATSDPDTTKEKP